MGDLYLLGNQKCLEKKRIAVVGTRGMSEYGRVMTELFVGKLVENDYCIVSGLARGIDRVAHETALKYNGLTIAVLGHGTDICYPPEHAGLKQRILDGGGLIVSEYGEGVRPTPDKFRMRDKLMAHLSQAILVMECPRRSGVKITVSAAAEEGINVYVVPGPIDQISYHGSTEIIRNGGIPVYSPEDLMEQLECC
jgi:DNA processing protein